MAQYYRDPFKTSSGKNEQRSLWLIAADAVMWILSIMAVTALLIIFVGRFVSPEKMWYFSLIGLVAPMIYIAVTFAMLYWIIRWKWFAVMFTGIFVLIGLFHVPLYYKLDFTKQYGEPVYNNSSIKVLTFNVHNFVDDNKASSIDSIARLIQSCNPDIICIQEYALDMESRRPQNAKFRSFNFGSDKLDNPSATMECLTKHNVIASHRIDSLGGTGVCIATDVVINEDTIRVYNVHLQTTSVTSDDKRYISQGQFISDSTRDQRFIHIARGLRQNNAMRAHQAEMLHADIAESPYPVILCGDFNDVPVSYAYRAASKGLEDSFSAQGHSYAHTFRGFFDVLRIDYIFSSPDFETVSYDVLPTGDISDHYPVLVRLKQTSKQ